MNSSEEVSQSLRRRGSYAMGQERRVNHGWFDLGSKSFDQGDSVFESCLEARRQDPSYGAAVAAEDQPEACSAKVDDAQEGAHVHGVNAGARTRGKHSRSMDCDLPPRPPRHEEADMPKPKSASFSTPSGKQTSMLAAHRLLWKHIKGLVGPKHKTTSNIATGDSRFHCQDASSIDMF